jgi:pyruvate/2-oxoglutarate dehydrogenase complex dihydrolipoamide dehydrogenase (E3) component
LGVSIAHPGGRVTAAQPWRPPPQAKSREGLTQKADQAADVVIVGAGTAGLTALREVRRRTDDFLLVNAGPDGTTCARVGCMPSKALIAAANALHVRTKLEEFGIRGGAALSADIPAVLQRVRRLRDDFVAGVLQATDDLGARKLDGRARLDGPAHRAEGPRPPIAAVQRV